MRIAFALLGLFFTIIGLGFAFLSISPLHRIEALAAFVVAAVFFVGEGVLLALREARRERSQP